MSLQDVSQPLAPQSNSDPLVSCIIIFLNGAAFLAQAIESVLSQSYSHWELWLVDDGSTDESTQIARTFAAHCPNVYYLEHEGHRNWGMSASRNLGIRHARGQFVAFLDADDLWLPTKLAEQVAVLLAYPSAGMVYGRTQIWHSWQENGGTRPDYFYDLGVTPNRLITPPQLLPLLLANRVQTPTTCNFIVRREVLEAIGGFEDAFRGLYEDQAFYVKTHTHVPVYVADRFWAKYRQHDTNSTKQSASQRDYFSERLTFLKWVEGYLLATGSADERVWRALHYEIWRCQHPRLMHIGEYWRRKLAHWISRGKGAFQLASHYPRAKGGL